MGQAEIATIIQDAVITVLVVSLPCLGIGLVVGLVISIFQATTQIQEQTLVIVAKIAAVFIALIIFFPWMMSMTSDFTHRLYGYILTMLR